MSKRHRRRNAGRKQHNASFAAPALRPGMSADLFRSLANNRNDMFMPQFSKILRPTDYTLLVKGGGKGIRLYDEILQDGHAYSVLNKRKDKVIAREWQVVPAEDDNEDAARAAELVEKALKRIAFDVACKGLLDATLYGYAVSEVVWEVADGLILPKAINRHPPRRFVFDIEGNPRLLTAANPGEGEALPDRKFIVHRYDEDGADPYGRGLGRVLFWHILFKREGVGFWANFLEKYGSPTPVGKYPVGTPPEAQDRFLNNLADMVQKGALVVPLGSEVDFLESSRDGKVSYGDWCDYWDQQTSIAVLGETLTTSLDGEGSRAATETHLEVSDGIADADSDLLSATLNRQLVQWIIDYNMPGAPAPSIFRPRPKNQTAEEQYKTARAGRIAQDIENAKLLAAAGFRPKQGLSAYFSEIFGEEIDLMNAEDKTVYADLIAAAQQPAAAGGGFGDMGAGGALGFAAPDAHEHGLTDILDQIEDVAQPVVDGWLEMIKSRLLAAQRQGKTLAQMREDLLSLYPELETLPFGEILGNAQAVAELMGRQAVEDDTRQIAGGVK